MNLASQDTLDFQLPLRAPRNRIAVFHATGEDEVQLSYQEDGHGQSVVWLHWIGGDSSWQKHHQRLASRFHLYGPNLPGYDSSSLPAWAKNPRDWAILILRFLDVMQIHRPTIVGSCLGGWVAAELAILRPERIAKLVLLDPLGLALEQESFSHKGEINTESLSRQLLAQTTRAPLSRDGQFLSLQNVQLPQGSPIQPARKFSLPLHSEALAQHLPLLVTPTLVLWGEHDTLLSPQHAALWTALLPHARGAIIPGAGHLPYMDNCTAVAEVIEAFIMEEHVTEEF